MGVRDTARLPVGVGKAGSGIGLRMGVRALELVDWQYGFNQGKQRLRGVWEGLQMLVVLLVGRPNYQLDGTDVSRLSAA